MCSIIARVADKFQSATTKRHRKGLNGVHRDVGGASCERCGNDNRNTSGPPSNPAELADRALHRRAIEAVIWGMPAVNFDLMQRQLIKLGGAPNQVVFWSRPVSWKNQTLTPNPDTIYFMPFFNTKDVGPVVLEIPPADTGTIVGSVDDCWQTAIEDVGPAGADKGDGGRYLVLPPDHAGDAPDGYIPLRSPTYQSFALLRSNYRSAADADIADCGRLRETRSGLSTFGGGRPAADHIHRRDRRLVRRDHPLRRPVFRFAEPHRADRAVADPRQGDDRHAEDDRHREG